MDSNKKHDEYVDWLIEQADDHEINAISSGLRDAWELCTTFLACVLLGSGMVLAYGEGNHLILPGEGWINRECAGLVGAVQHLI